MYISIHKALAGLDISRLRARYDYIISIHKALAGLDCTFIFFCPYPWYFNPQGPRGPRPEMPNRIIKESIFQSTRPSRASTARFQMMDILLGDFNPQGPRGPRPLLRAWRATFRHFNPQGPRGPRHLKNRTLTVNKTISIHKALAGLDEEQSKNKAMIRRISIHKALAGLDLTCVALFLITMPFQSTRPSRASTST